MTIEQLEDAVHRQVNVLDNLFQIVTNLVDKYENMNKAVVAMAAIQRIDSAHIKVLQAMITHDADDAEKAMSTLNTLLAEYE